MPKATIKTILDEMKKRDAREEFRFEFIKDRLHTLDDRLHALDGKVHTLDAKIDEVRKDVLAIREQTARLTEVTVEQGRQLAQASTGTPTA